MSPELQFEIIVPGWNCADFVRPCWDSIIDQSYVTRVHFYDDASSDPAVTRAIAALPPDPRRVCYRGSENLGAAHARDFCIRQTDPRSIVVLVDMDDRLAPSALLYIATVYRTRPWTRLTYGSWVPDVAPGVEQAAGDCRRIPLETLRARSFRRDGVACTHLRTFRRDLFDELPADYGKGPDARWVECVTDLALMWPLLERCAPVETYFVPEPLYVYSWRRAGGTVARFGLSRKAAIRAHLQGGASCSGP